MSSSRHLLLVSILSLSVGLLACVANDKIPVSTNYDPLVRFPAEARYVWDEAANSLPEDPAIDRKASDALLKEVANEAFGAHGYHVTDGPPADYRLSYEYAVHTFYGVDVSRATGTVSLLLTDYASGRRVWMGFGRAEVHVGRSLEERRARLADALARMLEDFPPSSR